jgi:hypothetical protein
MNRLLKLAAPGCFAALLACSATGEAQQAAVVVAAVGKVVDGLATEVTQRQSNDTLRALPVVVRNAAPNGAESVIAEMLRTRLIERGVVVEVACPAKCFEVSLVEFVAQAGAQATAGQLVAINAGTISGLDGAPRAPGDKETLAAGLASALLVTFAARDGNRYGTRQQIVAIVAVARAGTGNR